jgi:hypothetical protein
LHLPLLLSLPLPFLLVIPQGILLRRVNSHDIQLLAFIEVDLEVGCRPPAYCVQSRLVSQLVSDMRRVMSRYWPVCALMAA